MQVKKVEIGKSFLDDKVLIELNSWEIYEICSLLEDDIENTRNFSSIKSKFDLVNSFHNLYTKLKCSNERNNLKNGE